MRYLSRIISMSVAVALLLGSCAAAPTPKTQVAQPEIAPQIVKEDIVGHWEGDWGSMYLKVVGGNLRGVYTHDDGRVTGTFANGVFKGWWSEVPSREAPDDAGAVEFTLSRRDGALSLDGRWKYGNDAAEEWYDDWDLGWDSDSIPAEIDPLFAIDADFAEP